MFDETWKWAGVFRQIPLNIGTDWHNITVEAKKLADDLVYWETQKDMNLLEQSVRLHHRLVMIHPFINGNGRHARLASDIFLFSHDQTLPIWPDKVLIEKTEIRKEYIEALQAADKSDYQPLLIFTKKLIK